MILIAKKPTNKRTSPTKLKAGKVNRQQQMLYNLHYNFNKNFIIQTAMDADHLDNIALHKNHCPHLRTSIAASNLCSVTVGPPQLC